MNIKNNQKGAGMLEVLVALFILAVGVLGFVALQYRAVDATIEGSYRVQAINVARDLSERIRVNRIFYDKYVSELNTPENQKNYNKDCSSTYCTFSEIADFDVAQVATKANSMGMTMNIMPCKGNVNGRNCIYVAWGNTSATDGTGITDCTNNTSYVSESTCLIMETY